MVLLFLIRSDLLHTLSSWTVDHQHRMYGSARMEQSAHEKQSLKSRTMNAHCYEDKRGIQQYHVLVMAWAQNAHGPRKDSCSGSIFPKHDPMRLMHLSAIGLDQIIASLRRPHLLLTVAPSIRRPSLPFIRPLSLFLSSPSPLSFSVY